MMRKIITTSAGHGINTSHFPKPKDFLCTSCATGKLIIRPSYHKIKDESLRFLERIQDDICGPIHPLSGPFQYFMVLRCFYEVEPCVPIINTEPYLCKINCPNHSFTC
jgi:hypothetical protein